MTTPIPPTVSTTEMNVITPKKMEEECRQTIAITNALSMLVMIAINIMGMFTIFTKIEKMFNPARVTATIRAKRFRNRVNP